LRHFPHEMSSKQLPSLASLASQTDPLSDLGTVFQRLRLSTAESKFLEWKLRGPFGNDSSVRTKYRTVKATISFANTDGGFIIFGIHANGSWLGLSNQEFEDLDPAKLEELVNGCVFPELPQLNFAKFESKKKWFAVLHTPPSDMVPHVTTKRVVDTGSQGKKKIVLAKYAVYHRHGAKSDIATPLQHQKMVEKRTNFLREELVRRIREVPISVYSPSGGTQKGIPQAFMIARSTDDPTAPVVRLSRGRGQVAGIFLHEELSDGVFDEINNVLDANKLLAEGKRAFVLGDETYYRVYAERQHVESTEENLQLLVVTSLREMYVPFLFWFSQAPAKLIAQVIVDVATNPRSPQVYSLLKLVTLLGSDTSEWLATMLDEKWRKRSQRPNFYWAFTSIRNRTESDRRLLAMRKSAKASINLPDTLAPASIKTLLDSPQQAAAHLSKVCLNVFKGDKEARDVARTLDVAAYGQQVIVREAEVWDELCKLLGLK